MRLGSSCLITLVCCLAVPGSAAAQTSPARSWGFVSARYSTGSSALFGGYGYGPAFGVAGMIINPRSGYTELIGGAGLRFSLGRASSHTAAIAAARATDASYAQLYYLPSITFGRITTELTLLAYMPNGPHGTKQFYVNPASVLVALPGGVSIGASYRLGMEENIGTRQGAGPTIQMAVPKGALTVDLLRGMQAFKDEARVSFRAFF